MGTTHDQWGSLDYNKCLKILGRKDSRHLCNNNTYLILTPDGLPAVRLWSTNILTFNKDGSVIINSGGWHSVTTQNRIGRYCPYGGVYSAKGEWRFFHSVQNTDPSNYYYEYLFEDGMVVSETRVSTDRVALGKFQEITGIPVKSVSEMQKNITCLDFKRLTRLYKKSTFKWDVIIQAPKEFLPTLIGIVPEPYLVAFENRLAG